MLGGTVRVPTLTGAVEMKIPPMTDSGRTFRLRGKGLPTKSGHGDLLVTTEIRLPADADEALMDYARKRRAAKTPDFERLARPGFAPPMTQPLRSSPSRCVV